MEEREREEEGNARLFPTVGNSSIKRSLREIGVISHVRNGIYGSEVRRSGKGEGRERERERER
jgi:hypothetical protein